KSRPDAARRILETYRGVILAPAGFPVPNGYTRTGLLSTDFVVYDGPGDPPVIHPRLALLLTTSGSTGDPKLVRLTGRNLAANAFAISEYLQLTPAERSIQSLPMYYSYGLSLIHSH